MLLSATKYLFMAHTDPSDCDSSARRFLAIHRDTSVEGKREVFPSYLEWIRMMVWQ